MNNSTKPSNFGIKKPTFKSPNSSLFKKSFSPKLSDIIKDESGLFIQKYSSSSCKLIEAQSPIPTKIKNINYRPRYDLSKTHISSLRKVKMPSQLANTSISSSLFFYQQNEKLAKQQNKSDLSKNNISKCQNVKNQPISNKITPQAELQSQSDNLSNNDTSKNSQSDGQEYEKLKDFNSGIEMQEKNIALIRALNEKYELIFLKNASEIAQLKISVKKNNQEIFRTKNLIPENNQLDKNSPKNILESEIEKVNWQIMKAQEKNDKKKIVIAKLKNDIKKEGEYNRQLLSQMNVVIG